MTVGEMLARMSSRELTAWQIYERMYGPLGPQRDDQLAALIAATVANAFRGKGDKPAKVSEYVPDWASAAREEVTHHGDDPELDHSDRGA